MYTSVRVTPHFVSGIRGTATHVVNSKFNTVQEVDVVPMCHMTFQHNAMIVSPAGWRQRQAVRRRRQQQEEAPQTRCQLHLPAAAAHAQHRRLTHLLRLVGELWTRSVPMLAATAALPRRQAGWHPKSRRAVFVAHWRAVCVPDAAERPASAPAGRITILVPPCSV